MPKADILIVEDDRIVAEDTRITLEKLGFGVSGIVPSAKDALNRVEAEPPDLVLMDIVLEGEMDGIEAAAYGFETGSISRLCMLPVMRMKTCLKGLRQPNRLAMF